MKHFLVLVILAAGLLLLLPVCVTPALAKDTSEQPLTAGTWVDLAEKVVPSVVNISTTMTVKSPFPRGFPQDFFNRFFGELNGQGFGFNFNGPNNGSSGNPGKIKETALGSGVIIDGSGIILTNNHVVSDAEEIKIQFTEEAGERAATAKVIGRDPDLDIALLKVSEKRKMVPLKLGNSDALRVGDLVMAVGNPFGQGHSATHGIISGKGRSSPDLPLSNYLQTDAPINPGNSGGPLVNLNGEVIGINTAIEANAQGIGFAVPSNLISGVLPQLRTTGHVLRGYLGVLIEPLTTEVAAQVKAPEDLHAPLVANVTPGGPADEAGLKTYDVITRVGSDTVRTPEDLSTRISSMKPGEKIEVNILREGKDKTLTVTLGKRPTIHRNEIGRNFEEEGPGPEGHKAGLTIQNLNSALAQDLGIKNKSGVLVTNVDPGSPGDRAGLTSGDVIVEVNRKPVTDVHEFMASLKHEKEDLLRVEHPQVGPDAYSVAVLDLSKK